MAFDIAAVDAALAGQSITWSVEYVAETGSTNEDIVRLARAGAAEGAVLVCGHQAAGCGRQGRQWLDRPGQDLLFSVLLRPNLPAREYGMLSLLAAVAVAQALTELTGSQFGTKWPNDIVISGRKVAGLLLEADASAGYAIIGIGINVLGAADSLPDGLTQPAGTVYEATGAEIRREELLAAILGRLGKLYEAVADEGWQALLSDYRQIDTVVGSQVKLVRGQETVTGMAERIDEGGRLVIAGPAGRIVADAGDVHLVQ